MIRISELKLDNFMSYEKATLRFPKKGLWLLEGRNLDEAEFRSSNGAGKSAVIDALTWCLYGKTLRGGDADSVVHALRKKCSVSVEFWVGESRYSVYRVRVRGVASSLVFECDTTETVLTKGTISATQEDIEAMLGADFRTFTSAVAFGGTQFRFSALSDAERLDVLNRLLGTGLYVRAAEIAKLEADTITKQIRQCSTSIFGLKTGLAVHREERLKLRDLIDAEKNSDQQQLDKNLVIMIDEMNMGIASLAYVDNELAEVEDKRDQLLGDSSASSVKLTSARGALKVSENLLQMMRKGDCPTCGSPWQPSDLATTVANRDMLRTEVVALEALCESQQRGLSELRSRFKELSGVFDNRSRKEKARDKALAELALVRSTGTERLRNLKASSEARHEQIKALKLEIAKETEKLEEFEKAHRFLIYIQKLIGQGAVRAAIEGAVPAANEKAAEVAQALAGDNMDVKLTTSSSTKGGKEVDKLGVEIGSKHGAQSYAGSSQGERAAADLCLGMGLQGVAAGGAKFNIAFYDEVFDSMDENAANRAMMFLREEAEDKVVYVVSHAEWLKSADFDGVLTAVKDGGSSHLEEV